MPTTTFPDLFEQGGYHVDPQAMAQAVRELKSANSGKVAASLIVSQTSCLCFGITVSSVSAQFIQLFDLAALPADTAVPTLSFEVAATSTKAVLWIPPRSFRNGLVLCNSSTQHTKTIGSADCIFDVQYL